MHYSHMAEHVRSRGRGDDTMLIHMTPAEVSGLQNLAMAHGGSLTINPDTGLPEAGWLGKLLPTLLGGLGMAFGIPPVWMGALGAIGGTAITGDIKQGLMAGLGAFGGASLAGAAGLGGALGHVGAGIGLPGSTAAVMHPAVGGMGDISNFVNGPANAANIAAEGGKSIAQTGIGAAMSNFGQAAQAGLPGGIIGRAAPMLAATGAIQGVSNAFTPTQKDAKQAPDEYGYIGPYQAHSQALTANAITPGQMANFDPYNFDSSERDYFGPMTYTDRAGNPWIPGQKTTPKNMRGYAGGGQIGNNQTAVNTQTIPQPAQQMMDGSYSMQSQPQSDQQSQPQPQMPMQTTPSPYMQSSGYGQPQGGIKGLPGLAAGGTLHMRSGSFVMPARETAEFGNGSSSAGQQVLAKLGGTPIHGSGDGVSDSVPARINGKQQARVARDEVHFSPEAVARVGGGDHKKGTQKLYALMDKAQKARMSAKRGQDTGLRAIA